MPSKVGNFFMKALITSPLHRLLGSNFALITVTGRKSGKAISTPINVTRDGRAFIVTSQRSRTWWRNLRNGAVAQLHVAGKTYPIRGEIAEKEDEVVRELRRYFEQNPQYAKYYGIRITSDGHITEADLQKAAVERIMIRLLPVDDLSSS